ncbi:MAG: hypothetical protein WA418_12790 [Bradyrhizobium sp.]
MLKTALWAAGVLFTGGGGLWIAAFFLPSAATLLTSALDFVKSPVGTLLAMAGVVFFAFSTAWVGGDLHGTNATRAEWRADIARRAKAAADREAALSLDMHSVATRFLRDDGAFGKHLDDEVTINVAKAPKRPECRATGDDIKRLLSIR